MRTRRFLVMTAMYAGVKFQGNSESEKSEKGGQDMIRNPRYILF